MRVLSALLSLAEGECEREAVSVKGCKLSADAIIRTGLKSMNPQQQQQQLQQQAQQVRSAAPVSSTHSNGSARGVVAAVIGGGGNRPATAFSFEQRTGAGGGGAEKGSAAMAATNTSSILLHLAVDSCAFALHSMLETQRRSPMAASMPSPASEADGSGSELELTSTWLGGMFPVSALCFDCQLLIAPVVDAAGSMHRFMVVVSEVKRRSGAVAGIADEDGSDETERDERLRDMVEERVRRWRDGNGGKKRRKRAKVDRSVGKKITVLAAIKRETSNGSSSSSSQPARKVIKTNEGKRKMDE